MSVISILISRRSIMSLLEILLGCLLGGVFEEYTVGMPTTCKKKTPQSNRGTISTDPSPMGTAPSERGLLGLGGLNLHCGGAHPRYELQGRHLRHGGAAHATPKGFWPCA